LKPQPVPSPWVARGVLVLVSLALAMSGGGYGPRVVRADDLPSAPTLVAPNGAGTSATPSYLWNAQASATDYYLWVNDSSGTPVVQQWFSAASVCTGATCSATPTTTLQAGWHTWWVEARNSAGAGPWSSAMSFTVGSLPAAPTLIAPNGAGIAATPTYTWNAVSGATQYYLWVNDAAGTAVVQSTYTTSSCSGSTCSVSPTTALGHGWHTWWIQAKNASGDGPWSAGMSFLVGTLPAAPTLVSPTGTGVSTTPAYTWNAVSDATDYYLWVNDASGSPVIQTHYAAAASCSGATCTATPSTVLARGFHVWWIQAKNDSGEGPWSAGSGFTVGEPPVVPTLVSPTGAGTSATPTYTWNPVPDTTEYYLWVNSSSGTPVVQAHYPPSICTGASCAATPSTALARGYHTWWIQAKNASGEGPWSAGMSFVVGALPGAATLISPSGPTHTAAPTYIWNGPADATEYYLWVNNASGVPVIQTWYPASEVCGGTACSVTPPTSLANGSYTWWIQVRNDSGDGPWSAGTSFTVSATGAVSAGDEFSLALKRDGSLWGWGNNREGEIGDGTSTDRSSPVRVGELTNVKAVAAGSIHTLALLANGTVWASGYNAEGELGDGTNANRFSPAPVNGLTGVKAIAAGDSHSLALLADGTVKAWGDNSVGQIGDGTTEGRYEPVAVAGLTGVVAIAAGDFHSLALKGDGSVWAWGANSFGELGDGSGVNQLTPVQVGGLSGIQAIGSGPRAAHSFALGSDGSAWGWGDNRSGQLGTGTTGFEPLPVRVTALADIERLSAGYQHSLAVTSDGRVLAWGDGSMGQLGNGTTDGTVLPAEVPGLTGVVDVAAGWGHSLALKSDGQVLAWGDSSKGQVGDGTLASSLVPVSLSEPGFQWRAPTPVLSVVSGVYHNDQAVVISCSDPQALIYYTTNGGDPSPSDSAIVSGGSVLVGTPLTLKARAYAPGAAASNVASATYTFKAAPPAMSPPGGTYPGPLNVSLTTATEDAEIRYTTDGTDPDQTSVLYSGMIRLSSTTTLKARAFRSGWQASEIAQTTYTLPGRAALTGGGSHTLVLLPDGALWAFGDNSHGQLGLPGDHRTPARVPVTDVIAVSAGWAHTLALRADGTVLSWGAGNEGQLGTGGTADSATPTPIPGLSDVVAVSAGWLQSFVLKRDGTVWAFGTNDVGQLGDGTQTNRLSPVPVSGLSNVTAIAGGWLHGLALKQDGTAWVWGDNSLSELGDGTTAASLVPKQVPGLSDLNLIATGPAAAHSFARTSDGRLWGWGLDDNGELGLGAPSDREPTPIEVTAIPDAREVSAGGDHTVVLRADGTVWTMGDNSAGQLGDGTRDDRAVPAQVQGLTDIVQVAAGWTFSLALDRNGRLFAWGDNASSQLGDGTVEGSLSPIELSESSFLSKAAAPSFSVPSGEYHNEQAVAVSCPSADAVVRYTTNGIDPAESDPIIACGDSLTIDDPATLKARAWAAGFAPSDVAQATYSFTVGPVRTSPPSGTYSGATLVALSSETTDAEIRYTTDGSEPTDTSERYEGALVFDTTTTLQAKAYRGTWPASETVTATFTIRPFRGDISAGGNFSLALDTEGHVWAWGEGGDGQLGNGANESAASPNLVSGLNDVMAIAAGSRHALALTRDRRVWAWGAGDFGQLGLGTTSPRSSPVEVASLAGALAIAAGGDHSLVVRADGSVWAFGANAAGELGDGTTQTRFSPVPVEGLANVVAVAAGKSHSLALTSDKLAWAWGAGGHGQLGDGTFEDRPTPVQVTGLAGVDFIAAGEDHSLAITSDGAAWTWGNGGNGQLGDNGGGDEGTAVAVVVPPPPHCEVDCDSTFLTDIRSLAGGGVHSLAATADGQAFAWGGSDFGQLGDGSEDSQYAAEAIYGVSNVLRVSAGHGHSLALTADGEVWSWGLNESRQVGDGSNENRLVPVKLSDANFAWRVASPTITPGSGLYSAPVSVAIVEPTPGATIHYTTDGSEPTEASPLYAGPFTVDVATTVRAKAFRPGWVMSDTSIASYTFNLGTLAAPVFTPTGPAVTSVHVSMSALEGATIYYTVDGNEPYEGASLYAGPVLVEQTTTIKAIATKPSWTQSPSTAFTYTVYVARPAITPAAGLYASGQSITVTNPTPGATVHYTTNGSDPTLADPVFPSVGIPVGTFTLKTKAWKAGCEPSAVARADYALAGDPQADPDHDGLTTAQEQVLGTDPLNLDTNGDGIPDGAEVAMGLSPTNPDMDGDGVLNAVEIAQHTDPFKPDTDGDGVADGTDCFPLDPTKSECQAPDPDDHTPPTITLLEPANATLVSSNP
jgi:alpha-tubulin suppressor-like RCC1 family protein